MAEVFSRSVQVRFGDCDPAGIVFYPRYFEMFNNLVEDWCAEGLGIGGSSLTLVIRLRGQDGLERVRATLVLALMELKTARATRIPEPMRARIAQYRPPEQIQS